MKVTTSPLHRKAFCRSRVCVRPRAVDQGWLQERAEVHRQSYMGGLHVETVKVTRQERNELARKWGAFRSGVSLCCASPWCFSWLLLASEPSCYRMLFNSVPFLHQTWAPGLQHVNRRAQHELTSQGHFSRGSLHLPFPGKQALFIT